MKVEIIHLDRTRIHEREEKRHVGMKKQTIPNVDTQEIVQKMTVK